MAMFKEDRFKAALGMINVSPDDYMSLSPEMILHIYGVIAEAEKQIKNQEESASVHGKGV